MRDGSGRAHFEIAADERDADRVAFTQRTRRGLDVERLPADAAADHRHESRRRGRRRPADRPSPARTRSARAASNRPQHRAELRAGRRGHAHRPGRRPAGRRTARCRAYAARQRGGQLFARDRQLDPRLLGSRRARVISVASFISAIGVMPAIGFLRERPDRVRHRADQPAVDVDGAAAHAGGDTGLRRAARPRAAPGSDRAADPGCCAARRGCATLNSWSSVPANTVRPTPTMPALISSTGISGVAAGRGIQQRTARRDRRGDSSNVHGLGMSTWRRRGAHIQL